MESTTFRKRAGWLAFALCLFVYVLTLCPTIYWDDAGELIAASYTLGIPHPPGHPLYVLIGKLFTLIPLGSVAWRVNLMSAFFGALSCLVLYKIILERLEEKTWKTAAALGGAFFFAFAPTVWDQATVAETSTLHSFFMLVLTFFAFRLASGGIVWKSENYSLCLFSFIYGLSLTNHVAGVFFFPAFAYILIMRFRGRIFAPRLLGAMLAFFFLGLLVYAYLPIRSMANPPIDWGNPETLSNFIWVITARQYAPNLASELSLISIGANLVLRARDLLHQFTVVGCALGLVGGWALYRTERRIVVFSLLVIGVLFYIGLNSAFISAYFIPAIALLGVWIGVGLQRMFGWIARFSERIDGASLGAMMKSSLCALLAASFVLPLGIHFKEMDRSDDRYALRYGEQLLSELPDGSALFTVDGYSLFILWYLIYCEGRRPDLMVIEPTWLSGSRALSSQVLDQYPDLALPSPETLAHYVSRATGPASHQNLTIQAVLDANSPIRRIYWGMVPGELPFVRNLVPQGIVYRYSSRPVTMDEAILARNREFWNSELEAFLRDPAMARDKVVHEIYPVELNNQGLLFERLGRYDLAEWATDLALKFNPEYPVSRYNLGRLYARAGHHDEAIKEYQRAIEGNPYMAVAYYNMGNAYKSLGRFEDAFLAYRDAVCFYPSYYEAITALGQLHLLAGQTEDAAQAFQRALEVEPKYAFATRGLASVYLQTNRLDEAKHALDRALEQDPDSPAGLYALAKYHARSGDRENATDALRRSIGIGGRVFLDEAMADDDLRDLVGNLSANEEVRIGR